MIFDADRLIALAAEHDTPYYLYDLDAIEARIRAVRAAFGAEVSLLYAMKANPSVAILRSLLDRVDALDVSSLGEIEIAMHAGWPASRLSFTGPGKTEAEIARAIELGVQRIVVESEAEIERVGRSIAVLVRINPPERMHAFAVPATGKRSAFGIDDDALSGAARAIVRNQARFEGLHVHAGSQCRSAAAFLYLVDRVLERASMLRRDAGLISRDLDFGGGFGVTVSEDETPLALDRLSVDLVDRLERFSAANGFMPRASFELGRYAVADAGVYVARVVSVKRSYGTTYAVLDGGFNHLLSSSAAFGDPKRPRAPIANLTHPDAAPSAITLVGPLCTPLDVFAEDLVLPSPSAGDLVAFRQVGAYGYTLSPLLFLGHETPLELVHARGGIEIARRRRRAIEWAT